MEEKRAGSDGARPAHGNCRKWPRLTRSSSMYRIWLQRPALLALMPFDLLIQGSETGTSVVGCVNSTETVSSAGRFNLGVTISAEHHCHVG
jgi:hypothetical protein